MVDFKPWVDTLENYEDAKRNAYLQAVPDVPLYSVFAYALIALSLALFIVGAWCLCASLSDALSIITSEERTGRGTHLVTMIVLMVISTIAVVALQAPISSNLTKGNAMNDSEYKSFVAKRTQFDSLPRPRQQLLDEVEYVYGLEDISCYYDSVHLVKVNLTEAIEDSDSSSFKCSLYRKDGRQIKASAHSKSYKLWLHDDSNGKLVKPVQAVESAEYVKQKNGEWSKVTRQSEAMASDSKRASSARLCPHASMRRGKTAGDGFASNGMDAREPSRIVPCSPDLASLSD